MTIEERCKTTVPDGTGWHRYQCSRKDWKDGYCKQHHPDIVKARRQASLEKWDKESKVRQQQCDRKRKAMEILEQIEAGTHVLIPKDKP